MTLVNRSLSLLAISVLLLATAAGCRAKPASETLSESGPDADRSVAVDELEPERVSDPFGTQADLSEESLSEESITDEVDVAWVESQLQTVYFAFDQSSLSEAARAALDQNAEFLQNNPAVTIRVEGHCDERGTVEYNLALGDRRASSVKEYLVSRGVAPERLEVVSYGQEQPADPGQNDAAWARNRRAEFHVR